MPPIPMYNYATGVMEYIPRLGLLRDQGHNFVPQDPGTQNLYQLNLLEASKALQPGRMPGDEEAEAIRLTLQYSR